MSSCSLLAHPPHSKAEQQEVERQSLTISWHTMQAKSALSGMIGAVIFPFGAL